MRKVYFSVLLALISFASFAQEAIITGYVDSPCSGAAGRVLEIYVNGTIDFTGWAIGRQSNGDVDGYDTNLDISELGSITDDFAYITNDEAIFEAEFGTMSNVIVNNGINSNGNDAFQIVDNNSTVIDRFGEEFTDGSDTAWEHTDSYYLRNTGETANGGNFDASNWTFGALDELDDQGSCNGGTPLNEIITLGSFTPASTPEPAPLGLGKMAFTAFNADGSDDFAIVTFTDIPANTSIYFSDKEWTGTELNAGESSYEWNTGNTVIPAGTVIAFNSISETPSVTYGNIIGQPGGLSGGSEAIFAFLGTDVETPTEFITAIANSTSAFGTLENTGLVQGLTASVLPEGTDIADYTGPRTGLDTNGYQLALNNWTNFDIQDTEEDDHNDGTSPDLPFDLTMFNLSTTDVTAPQVVNVMVENQTTVTVVFSEEVSETTAINIDNYSFSPSLTITGITYDATTSTATLANDGFTVGSAYNLTVEHVEDTAATAMESSFTSEDLFYNDLMEGLMITEIMYNAPSDASDELEFLEIYNNTDATINLGGIQVKDEDNFVFTFPEMELASEGIVLLATDKTAAEAFYGVTFLDMPQGIINALSNGGELLEILNTEGTLIFSVEYDDGGAWPLADGDGPSIELLDPEGNFNDPLNYTEATNLVGLSMGEDIFASPGTFTPVLETLPVITFEESYVSVNESESEVTLAITLSSAPSSEFEVQVSPMNSESTAIGGQHFSFSQETLTFTPTGDLTQEVTVTITDNNDAEPDTFLVVGLEIDNSEFADLGENIIQVIYILDDEIHAPTAQENLGITFGTSYAIEGDNPGSEIVAHDAETERLFVLNSGNASVEILDFSNPLNISSINTIDLSTHGDQSTSVAHHSGIVAATAVPETVGENGMIIFMDTDGNTLSTVEVGALPDMITFSHDGNMLLVANEGQPSEDYTIDPEGTISVIDLTNGAENLTQANVTTLDFNAFDTQEEQLKTAGVRIFGPGASVSQDLEPEYITVSEDNTKAWVTLQENNAIAVIDLVNLQITDIWSLGYKDHSLAENALDTSNEQDFIFMANWPIKGMYMPDAIASYTVNGNTYYVTANEGDAREYVAYQEEVDLAELVLDSSVFDNQAFLKREENLGKLTFTNANGDIDNDDEYEELYVFGGRSFSIYDATTGTQVYDSGSDFERIIEEDPVYNAIFNANDDENKLKNRSDNKGPEPEAVIVQEINDTFYAFIGLERVGGFMVYDITNPNAPVFEGYYNNRSVTPGEDNIENLGDLAPESIVYVAPEDNAEEKGLIVLANEVSATISVYMLNNDLLSTNDFELAANNFVIYPNPAQSERVFFNKPTDYTLFDIQGRQLQNATQATHINVSTLTSGTYLIRNAKGQVQKLVIN